ncbi:hypothetical protein B9Z55_009626 [Caenorhabditis nigoni]|nr:hypothetical protein B9Z55_009626 [Caenorhabditis nigoni]
MKKLIKSSQITRFKSISHIVYANGFTEFESPVVYIPFTPKSDNIMEFIECRDAAREETNIPYFRLNVSGKIMNFRLHHKHHYLKIYFHPSDKESTIESIHNYFLDFFCDTVEYQYVENYRQFIPHLSKLSLCLSFWPQDWGRIRDIKNVEEYLASSPVLKWMNMSLDNPELFSQESKFYQAKSISLKLYSNNVPTFLRHFQGRQAFLRCYKWDILDLIEFMNKWKSGEECRKLEFLKITLVFDNPPNELLNANGVKHIDATKKPPTHTLPVVCKYTYFPNTTPITSHSYVVRITDNRVASVSIQGKSFCFGVWNKTEEEFLRMAT